MSITPSEVEAVAALTKVEREMLGILGAEIMTAGEIAFKSLTLTGHKVGHTARRSKLFSVFSRAKNYIALWELSPLGLAVRAHLKDHPNVG